MASEDLKERYRGRGGRGKKCLEAYVRSVEESRKMKIMLNVKDNGTVEFMFDSTGAPREALAEAKQDIQGEVCSVSTPSHTDPVFGGGLSLGLLELAPQFTGRVSP